MTEVQILKEDFAENSIVVSIIGQMDESNVDSSAPKIYEYIENLSEDCVVIFNFAGLEYMNSKSIGYTTDFYNKIIEKKGKMIIAESQPQIFDILQVVGLTQVIPFLDTVNEAKEKALQGQDFSVENFSNEEEEEEVEVVETEKLEEKEEPVNKKEDPKEEVVLEKKEEKKEEVPEEKVETVKEEIIKKEAPKTKEEVILEKKEVVKEEVKEEIPEKKESEPEKDLVKEETKEEVIEKEDIDEDEDESVGFPWMVFFICLIGLLVIVALFVI
jgi:anti-anti-sigma factor